jgi:hypothetical protein
MTETETNDRVPCPDEMCVGVMGEEGVCGTCGVGIEAAITHRERDVPVVSTQTLPETASRDSGDEDTLERVPCVDDMCVGILNDQGVCGTCGRSGLEIDGCPEQFELTVCSRTSVPNKAEEYVP